MNTVLHEENIGQHFVFAETNGEMLINVSSGACSCCLQQQAVSVRCRCSIVTQCAVTQWQALLSPFFHLFSGAVINSQRRHRVNSRVAAAGAWWSCGVKQQLAPTTRRVHRARSAAAKQQVVSLRNRSQSCTRRRWFCEYTTTKPSVVVACFVFRFFLWLLYFHTGTRPRQAP